MIERPPPPDLPTVQHPPLWRSIRKPFVVATLAGVLLIWEAVFDPGPVDKELVALYGWLLMSPGQAAGFELFRRWLIDREMAKNYDDRRDR